ncbi:helix-turn-helix domain-containing protein [Clostridium sporogenes]|uniref:helix-turn-helix domain-containing protein n=1 Tax=Clostridium sporogenes TaxID=1509 RepID=UPI00313ACA49
MGYTVIDNEVLENKDLNIQEQSLLIALISYYNKEKGYAYPSYKQLMNRSKIKSRTTFINTLNSLLTKKYIKRETIKGKGCKYFIKDFLPSTDIDQVQKCTRYKNVPTPSTDIDQQQVQKCTTTNTNTNTKTITNNIYIDLFNHWNDKKIIVHKQLTKEIEKAIKKSLKKYSKEEIVKAIDIYSEILNSEYYFNYKWTLKDFLNRENGISSFMDEGSNKVNYETWKEKDTGNIYNERLKNRKKKTVL